MKNEFFDEYSRFEDGLRKRFHSHPFCARFAKLTWVEFTGYLCQLGFLSQEFVKWYETAKLGMKSEDAREVVRKILRDEIPSQGPTHQDDRFSDLTELLQVPAYGLFTEEPSPSTVRAIKRLYRLICPTQDHYDLRALVALRVAGEVLVAEQYKPVVDYMRDRLRIDPRHSRFYRPHYEHDLKGAESGHTDSFDPLLSKLIAGDEELAIAKEAAQAAFEVRFRMHNQFVRGWWQMPLSLLQKAAVFAIPFALILLVFHAEDGRKREWFAQWQRSNESQSSRLFDEAWQGAARTYREADKWLVEQFQKTGDVGYLAKVGTSNVLWHVWGDGP